MNQVDINAQCKRGALELYHCCFRNEDVEALSKIMTEVREAVEGWEGKLVFVTVRAGARKFRRSMDRTFPNT